MSTKARWTSAGIEWYDDATGNVIGYTPDNGTATGVLTVGASGCPYTTVQAAVDAAALVYASSGINQVVMVYPGVTRLTTTTPGVKIMYVEDQASDRRTFVSQLLFSWRFDDGDNVGSGADGATNAGWWFTANTGLPDALIGGADATPAEYLFRRGIAPSIAMPTEAIGLAHYLSEAQLRYAVRKYGWDICSHGLNHTKTPATAGTLSAATLTAISVGAQATLNSILNDADGGAVLAGQIVSVVVPNGDGINSGWCHEANMNLTANHTNWVADYLRANIDVVSSYAIATDTKTIPPQYFHSVMVSGANNIYLDRGYIMRLDHASSAFTGSATAIAEFKAFADYIGKLIARERALNLPIRAYAKSQILTGSNTSFDAINVGTDSIIAGPNANACPLIGGGDHPTVTIELDSTDTNSLHEYPVENFHKCINHDGSAGTISLLLSCSDPAYMASRGFEAGKHYIVQWDAKLQGATGASAAFSMGLTNATYVNYSAAGVAHTYTSSWATYLARIYVPVATTALTLRWIASAAPTTEGFALGNLRIIKADI